MYERPQIITLSAKKGGDEAKVCGDPVLFNGCVFFCIVDSYCISLHVYNACVPVTLFNV